jgi:hypothetical protein
VKEDLLLSRLPNTKDAETSTGPVNLARAGGCGPKLLGCSPHSGLQRFFMTAKKEKKWIPFAKIM